MKKLFLIPLMTLLTCVMAWGENVNTAEEFQNAVTAKESEINLQNDITVENAQVTIKAGCTVNLNNHTIYYTKRATFLIVDVADPADIVTINNGTIVYTPAEGAALSSGNSVLMAKTSSHVILNNVNLGGLDVNGGYNCSKGLYVSGSNAVATLNGGVIKGNTAGVDINAAQFTLENGTIEGGQTGITVGSQTSTFVMNDGVVIGKTGFGVKNQGAATIYGGEISTPSSVVINQGLIATTSGFGIFNTGNNANLIINDGSISGQYGICNTTNAHLTVEGGTITGVSQTGEETHGIHTTYSQYKTNIYPSYTTIEEGATISAQYGVVVIGQGTSLNVNGGTINGTYYAISGNGNAENAGTTINITGGNISGDGAGIYHPQKGQLNISGSAVIKGKTGIQLCSGSAQTWPDMEISGGKIIATGIDDRVNKGTGDGLVSDGAAISIVNRYYPGGTPKFEITGGLFESATGKTLLAYTWTAGAASLWEDAANFLVVSGGYFDVNPKAIQPVVGFNPEVTTAQDYVLSGYSVDDVTFDAKTYKQVHKESTKQQELTDDETASVKLEAETAGDPLAVAVGDGESESSTAAEYVEVGKNVTVTVKDNATLEVGDGGLVLAEDGATLNIEEGATVVVGANGIISTNESNIVLTSNEENASALLLDPDVVVNTTPKATYKFKSKARFIEATGKYIWQRFGAPTCNGDVTMTWEAPVKTSLAKFNYTIHDWEQFPSAGDSKQYVIDGDPFQCYLMTINGDPGYDVEYTFTGELMGNTNAPLHFEMGWNAYANSYTAPIDVRAFLNELKTNFGEGLSYAIYLYDRNSDGTTNWNAVNNFDFELDEDLKIEIKPMQAFILQMLSGEAGTKGAISYEDNVYNPFMGIEPIHAPARVRKANNYNGAIITVSDGVQTEKLTFIEGEDFTDEFDNGYDAEKLDNENDFSLYCKVGEVALSKLATNDLMDKVIAFDNKVAGEFTLKVTKALGEGAKLYDAVAKKLIELEENTEYTFSAEAINDAARFIINPSEIPSAIDNTEIVGTTSKFMKDGQLYIRRGGNVYTVQGQNVK